MECGACGVSFAVPIHFYNERYNKGGDWYCPNGHCRHFCESEVVKLRAQLDAKQRELTASKCETMRERQLREFAEKQKARMSKRVQNGVCPCCNRTFQNLARHMATKHPEKKGQDGAFA